MTPPNGYTFFSQIRFHLSPFALFDNLFMTCGRFIITPELCTGSRVIINRSAIVKQVLQQLQACFGNVLAGGQASYEHGEQAIIS